MKKICLVYPNEMKLPSYFRFATNISTDINETLPPMGLLYIISNSRFQIDLIDNRVKKYNFKKLAEILMGYDIIGFGGTIFEIKEARRISQYLIRREKITIYGGPNATVNRNLYLEYFSIVLRGEAELMFDKVIDNINNLESLGFTKFSNTYVNSEPFRIKDLDKLNFPDRSKINLNDYRRKETSYIGDVEPVDVVVSSRGCPFDCYFCSSKVIWNQRYTFRSADNVIKEIKLMIKRYGTQAIYFREDNFTTNKKRLIEFCKKIKELNLVWMCESRVDTIDEKTIKLMAASGCRGIWFGIESTDDIVLKKIRKNITLKQIKSTISLCNKYNIATGGGFMLGFPFDNEESIRKNFRTSRKLNLKVVFYNRVWAIPKSDMCQQIIDEAMDYYSFENIILPGTKYLSANEVNRLYYKLISRKKIYSKKISGFLGENNIGLIKKNFPLLYRMVLWLKN